MELLGTLSPISRVETTANMAFRMKDTWQRVTGLRDLSLNQDDDGGWIVVVRDPAEPEVEDETQLHAIDVREPTVIAFLNELVVMLADSVGAESVTFRAEVAG